MLFVFIFLVRALGIRRLKMMEAVHLATQTNITCSC
ncbi:unnamed protein product [Blumeria hordei]|uniref:Uncharacterized protein n=1 Tax=Blumeria hordei TaxID=2867405 RepID=A0A383UVL5_BLUHO|nr:unnamed protein product [Blumeria hordei]